MKNLLGRIYAAVGISVLLSFPVSIPAGEIFQFAMHYTDGMQPDECALVPRFSTKEKEGVIYPGRLEKDACLVVFAHKDYEDKFDFCYLAGFNIFKGAEQNMIECVIQKRDHDYLFLASGVNTAHKSNQQVMCYFTCIGSDKN